jgi:hypothetical protein
MCPCCAAGVTRHNVAEHYELRSEPCDRRCIRCQNLACVLCILTEVHGARQLCKKHDNEIDWKRCVGCVVGTAASVVATAVCLGTTYCLCACRSAQMHGELKYHERVRQASLSVEENPMPHAPEQAVSMS